MKTNNQKIYQELTHFIESRNFCCTGAKRALKMDTMIHHDLSRIDHESINQLYSKLEHFSVNRDQIDHISATFVVTFSLFECKTEDDFEAFLWEMLNRLHEIDSEKYEWAEAYSSDVTSKNFGFSLASEAFFIVGLHPNASRISRRFVYPTIVFNAHAQFNYLKKNGMYEKLQKGIRHDEMRIQGSLNPHLSDFGEKSESCQYASKANMSDTLWKHLFIKRSL